MPYPHFSSALKRNDSSNWMYNVQHKLPFSKCNRCFSGHYGVCHINAMYNSNKIWKQRRKRSTIYAYCIMCMGAYMVDGHKMNRNGIMCDFSSDCHTIVNTDLTITARSTKKCTTEDRKCNLFHSIISEILVYIFYSISHLLLALKTIFSVVQQFSAVPLHCNTLASTTNNRRKASANRYV